MRSYLIILCLLTNLCYASNPENFEKTGFPELSRKDTLRIGLREAILMALEQNPTVTIQRLEPKITKSFADEHRAEFDPSIAASTSRNKSKIQRFLGSRREPFEMSTERSQYDLEISETLPTGTTISAYSSISGSISNIYTDQYTSSIGMTITQSLLRGFWPGANLAELRRARLDVEISKTELKAVAEQLVADVEKAYWDLYLAGQEINIQKKSLFLANRQLEESLERVAVGKLPELELAAVHAEVATRKEALIDAQSNYEQTRMHFLFLLFPKDRSAWSITPIPLDKLFVPVDSLDDISIHEKLGMKYRPDLKQARFECQKGKLDVTRTKNGLLPRLDLFITLGRNSYAKTFRDALPKLESPFYSIEAGISFDFSIPNREARARAARARYTNEQLKLAVNNMERLVQWDIRSAYIEVLRARQQIQATQTTRTLQEKKAEAELEKFRVGKSTNFLVLQAQRDLTASQLVEARAMVAHLNALVELYLMEGTLLDRRGISTSFETN